MLISAHLSKNSYSSKIIRKNINSDQHIVVFFAIFYLWRNLYVFRLWLTNGIFLRTFLRNCDSRDYTSFWLFHRFSSLRVSNMSRIATPIGITRTATLWNPFNLHRVRGGRKKYTDIRGATPVGWNSMEMRPSRATDPLIKYLVASASESTREECRSNSFRILHFQR